MGMKCLCFHCMGDDCPKKKLAERVEELEKIAKEGSALIVSIGKEKDKLAEQNEKMLVMLKSMTEDGVGMEEWKRARTLIAEIETKEDDNGKH